MYSELKTDLIVISLLVALFMSGYYVGVVKTKKQLGIGAKICQEDIK